MKKLISIFFCILCIPCEAREIVNVFNWGDYMPESVLRDFEKETGITVHYATFGDNSELYDKLKLSPNTYDIIVPSSYMADQMAEEGLLTPLDKNRLPNIKHLNPSLLNFSYDPGSQYSLPYFWGTTGIVVNDRYLDPNSITEWKDLWNPKFRDQLLMMDEAREIFDIAFTVQGHSINDNQLPQIEAAYQLLKSLLPNVKLFNEMQEASAYADEDAVVGASLNGDAYRAYLVNPHIHFILPKGKVLIWVDTIAIAKGAPHLDNAYQFLNFIMRPDIAARMAEDTGYSSPNQSAIALLPKEVRENSILYPDPRRLSQSEVESDLDEPMKQALELAWERLKLES